MRRTTFILLCFLSVMSSMLGIYPVIAESPTTTKIVFGSSRDGNREIYLMNPDGSQQINLTNHQADDVSPVFSPTGEQILFASDRDRFPGSWDLYLMDADGQNVRQVFEKSNDRMYPTWSPNGKQIAYMRQDFGEWYIYIATSNGKHEERMAIGGSPAWSPDGTEIALVVRVAPERLNIYILNVGTRKQKVFFPPDPISTARVPAWSPDGDKIAFAWHQKGPNDRASVYTLNRGDGRGLQKIVNQPGLGATDPVWDPDAKALVYTQRVENNTSQIFKIMLAGGPLEQLTDVGIWNIPADWFDPAYALPVSPQPQLLTTQWGVVKNGN